MAGKFVIRLCFAKFGIFNDLNNLSADISDSGNFKELLLVVLVKVRYSRALYFEWKHTTRLIRRQKMFGW